MSGRGQEDGASTQELDELSLLAVLHDIGKVGVAESVLQKVGPLTIEEWEEMKKHPEIGYRIARNIPELSKLLNIFFIIMSAGTGKATPRD